MLFSNFASFLCHNLQDLEGLLEDTAAKSTALVDFFVVICQGIHLQSGLAWSLYKCSALWRDV